VKIGVAGLWHLGAVYSVGFADLGHEVIAYDPDPSVILDFKNGKLRVFEPGLEELLRKNLINGLITFTDSESQLKNLDILVLAYDTPIDQNDNSDQDYVISEFRRLVSTIGYQTPVMVSSQLPVGSSEIFEQILADSGHEVKVIIQPENLRLGKALESFFSPSRIVIGTSDGKPDELCAEVFKGINSPIIWMHSKSAEMTKHALNSFLATSISFMGEIAEICENVGADAKEVEVGLKSDPRIGDLSYLSPGLGFSGGTLARDVQKLSEFQLGKRSKTSILSSIMNSNRHNNDWIVRTLEKIFELETQKKLCFWGVCYVENTNTLRRSEIYNQMIELVDKKAEVSFLEDFQFSEEIDSRLKYHMDIFESIKSTRILVILNRINTGNIWILDPSRVLLELDSGLTLNSKYFTVGKGI
jgi:UDPglucose 6-dehydrogenase